MNEQERIARAKDYIRNNQFEAAKVVLEELPKNAVAIQLISQIKETQAKRRAAKRARLAGRGGANLPPAPPLPIMVNVTGNHEEKHHEIPRPALLIIVGSMALWSIALIIFSIAMPSARPVPIGGLIAFLLGGNLVTFFLYWLFWKFYWWALALGWLLVSCMACVGLATLPQYLAGMGVRF
jgi:hypothetical protein